MTNAPGAARRCGPDAEAMEKLPRCSSSVVDSSALVLGRVWKKKVLQEAVGDLE